MMEYIWSYFLVLCKVCGIGKRGRGVSLHSQYIGEFFFGGGV